MYRELAEWNSPHSPFPPRRASPRLEAPVSQVSSVQNAYLASNVGQHLGACVAHGLGSNSSTQEPGHLLKKHLQAYDAEQSSTRSPCALARIALQSQQVCPGICLLLHLTPYAPDTDILTCKS